MEEMTRTIANNSEAIPQTNDLAQDNRQTARENGQAILQAVDKMEEIRKIVEATWDIMRAISALQDASDAARRLVQQFQLAKATPSIRREGVRVHIREGVLGGKRCPGSACRGRLGIGTDGRGLFSHPVTRHEPARVSHGY